MNNPLILIIEDDTDIRELLAYSLGKENYAVERAESAEEALEFLKSAVPDLILLDLMLPQMSGFECLTRIRADRRTELIPVIIVSARDDESDVVRGLELGAADYVTKPFSPRVLIARIRRSLRHVNRQLTKTDNTDTEIIQAGDFVFNLLRHELKVDGELIDLSATEFAVVEHLARSPGRVFTRSQIINAIRGEDYPVTERAIDVQILSIRKKLGSHKGMLETVRGIGYRFKDDVE